MMQTFTPGPEADTIEEAIHAVTRLKDAKIEAVAEKDDFAIAFCSVQENQKNEFLHKSNGKWSVVTKKMDSETKKIFEGSFGEQYSKSYYIEYFHSFEMNILYMIIGNKDNELVSFSDSEKSQFSTFTINTSFMQEPVCYEYCLTVFDELPENYWIKVGSETILIS